MNPLSAATATFPARSSASAVRPLLLRRRRRRLCNSEDLPLLASERSADRYFSLLIDSSPDFAQIRQIHSWLLAAGLLRRGFLVTKLIHACSRVGEVVHGSRLFEACIDPDIFLWNAVIKLHASHGDSLHATSLYARMLRAGVRPDGFTFPSVIRACSGDPVLRAVHAQAFRHGFCSDVFIQNGLVAVYSKCARIEIARKIFDAMPGMDRDVVSWTCVVSGFAQSGRPLEALEIFSKMRSSEHGVVPDFVLLVSAVKACAGLGELPHGKTLHSHGVKSGLDEEVDLQIALTSFYAQCGELSQARALFDLASSSPPLLQWNAMISGYAKNGDPREAVELFHQLTLHPHLRPDSISIRAAILAAARMGSLEMAEGIRSYISFKEEFKHDVLINTALIDMYSKCGRIEQAHKMFDEMLQKDVVAWSAIITGYAIHGRGDAAINLFHQMQSSGVKPNAVTFLAVLSACNHSGLVDEGLKIFAAMRAHGVVPRCRHYACMVDLLGRAGRVAEACELMAVMPVEPSVATWGALLSACRIHGDVPTGAVAAAEVVALDPDNVGHLVQLSNLFAGAGMWAVAGRVRLLMKEKGLVKASGGSVVEVDGCMQEFRCGDQSHHAFRDIYAMLSMIEKVSKDSAADYSIY